MLGFMYFYLPFSFLFLFSFFWFTGTAIQALNTTKLSILLLPYNPKSSPFFFTYQNPMYFIYQITI